MLVQQGHGCSARIAPRAMPEFDDTDVVSERAEKPADVISGLLRALKTGRKLDQERPKLAGRGQRVDAALERIDIGLRHRRAVDGHLRMREFLIQLDRELEVGWRALDPVQ